MTGRPRTVSDDVIFEAVAAVVTAVGPTGLTLAAVAARVGLSPPALTQRFGSKHGLLVAFATREATDIAATFSAARAAHPDPLTALVEALAGLPCGITTPEGLAHNLAFLQMDLTDPELRTHAVAQSRQLRAEIAALATEAVQAGQLAAATPPETLAADLYATYCGAMLTWAVDGSGELTGWLRAHLGRTVAPHRTPTTGEATP